MLRTVAASAASEVVVSSWKLESSSTQRPAARAARAYRRLAPTRRGERATSPSTNPCRPNRAPAPFCLRNSPQLQSGETEQDQHHGDDPEAHDDLGLLPPRELVVVVQRRHSENA